MASGEADDPHVPAFELSHAARMACVLIALAVTTVGFLLMLPYVGYAYSAAGFGPAAILLFFAARGRRQRWLLVLASAPLLGLGLSVYSAIWVIRWFGADYAPVIFIPPLLTSLITWVVVSAVERRSPRP
jgi:hypothetical protein